MPLQIELNDYPATITGYDPTKTVEIGDTVIIKCCPLLKGHTGVVIDDNYPGSGDVHDKVHVVERI